MKSDTMYMFDNPYQLFTHRREKLLDVISERYQQVHNGAILVLGGLEISGTPFRQESSCYYMTGLKEPGIALWIDLGGKSTVYVPHFKTNRKQWVVSDISIDSQSAAYYGLDEIKELGTPLSGYEISPLFSAENCSLLIEQITALHAAGGVLFTINPSHDSRYFVQQYILSRLQMFAGDAFPEIIDISDVMGTLRRIKDAHEIELISRAIEITHGAQEAAAHTIQDGINECDVQASLEFMMTGSQARRAFPSIVASGMQATVLHYHDNNQTMHDGELVVVDIGAEYEMYAADITRTYPVSKRFSPRQRELYELVLEVQEYIAGVAQPGYWLSNAEHPEQSLNHLARAYFTQKGYDQYFVHGIGHYLGLDVHDVGDYKSPLKEGDVITIEPGVYIPEEKTGIRIEDNYWLVKNGAICLSEAIPKRIEDIEQLMQEGEPTASLWSRSLSQNSFES